MIQNALTGEPKSKPAKTVAQQQADFTAEGAPAPVGNDAQTLPPTAAGRAKERSPAPTTETAARSPTAAR